MATTTIVFGPGTTAQSGGTIPAEVRQMYSMKLLRALDPELKHAQFLDPEPIPKHMGNTMIMRRFERIPVATTALTEGVTPPGSTPTVTTATVTVAQYGDWMPFSDLVTWTAIDKIVTRIVERQAEQTAETLDILSRNVMTGGTSVQYANSRTSRVTVQAGDNMTAVEIKKAVMTLETNFVKRFSDDCYIGIIHPHTKPDIFAISEWLAVHEYSQGQSGNLYKGEVGQLYGVRFIVSPLAQKYAAAGAAGIDVYATMIFGRDAFTKSSIDGESTEVILQPLGSAGTSDPLNQRQTSGWKATFGGTISQQLAALRVEHATTY